jgi:hypothetical protein
MDENNSAPHHTAKILRIIISFRAINTGIGQAAKNVI